MADARLAEAQSSRKINSYLDIDLRQADKTLSIVVLSIEAKRDAQFFIYRFLLLILFVVGMSWVIFWVPP